MNKYKKKFKYLSFEKAKEFAHFLNLKNKNKWADYVRLHILPPGVPKAPRNMYLNKGWKGWGDFLGTGRIANQCRIFLPFEEARKIVQQQKLSSSKEYANWKNRPNNIPALPSRTYKNKGWKGMGDYLGTNTIANQNLMKAKKPYEN